MSEKQITNKIIKYINNLPNGYARKRYTSGSSNTLNYPDITGSLNGIRLEIEVKQPGKKPSRGQFNKIRFFKDLKCIAFWCDSFESAKKQLITQYFEFDLSNSPFYS